MIKKKKKLRNSKKYKIKLKTATPVTKEKNAKP